MRYGLGSASSLSANGFFGSGEDWRISLGRTFVEKGRRVEIRDDKGGGLWGADESTWYVFDAVSMEL